MFSFISHFKKLVWVASAQCRKKCRKKKRVKFKKPILKEEQTCLALISNYLSETFLGEESITLSYSSYMSPLPAFLGPQRKSAHRIWPPSKLIMQYIH